MIQPERRLTSRSKCIRPAAVSGYITIEHYPAGHYIAQQPDCELVLKQFRPEEQGKILLNGSATGRTH